MARERIEIDEELEALRELRDQVPATSVFGDDNQEAIDAQLEVIAHNMTELRVLDAYEDEDNYTLSAALNALRWLREDDDPVSESWREMLEETCQPFLLCSA